MKGRDIGVRGSIFDNPQRASANTSILNMASILDQSSTIFKSFSLIFT